MLGPSLILLIVLNHIFDLRIEFLYFIFLPLSQEQLASLFE
jgi:hypothetical protein